KRRVMGAPQAPSSRLNIESFRTTPRTGSPRGPLCLMGACFDCLVIVDGVPNRQACLVLAADGMEIARQDGMGAPIAPS
ncbi:MAG: (2Fe-2S)-binding protein, partial [Pseudomonadota bacterium]